MTDRVAVAREVFELVLELAPRVGFRYPVAVGVGMLTNAVAESGLNPGILGDGGTSWGLWQLHRGGELDRYLREVPAGERETITAQTAYVLLRCAELSRVRAAANEGTVGQLAYVICTDFERPRDAATKAAQRAASISSLWGISPETPCAQLG